MSAPRNFTVRMQYTKRGKIRFTSHRDVARLFERAVRVAGIPMAYSEGFSPRPRFSFGLALPTTFASEAEYLDVILKEPVDPAPFPTPLTNALPEGLDVVSAAVLPAGSTSLQEIVTSSTWMLEVLDTDTKAVQDWIDSVLVAEEIPVVQERKGKKVERDIRPAILSLQTQQNDAPQEHDVVCIVAELANKPRALRPLELLEVFSPDFSLLRGRRLAQWISSDGKRQEPLDFASSWVASEESDSLSGSAPDTASSNVAPERTAPSELCAKGTV